MLTSTSNPLIHRANHIRSSLLMSSSLTSPTSTSCRSLNKKWNLPPVNMKRGPLRKIGLHESHILVQNFRLRRNVSSRLLVVPTYFHQVKYKATPPPTRLTLLRSPSHSSKPQTLLMSISRRIRKPTRLISLLILKAGWRVVQLTLYHDG